MSEHGQRLARLRDILKRRSLYVSALPNIRYLTRFTGSAGHVLVTPDTAILFTDGRYRSQARRQASGVQVVISRGSPLAALARMISEQRLRRVGFESQRIPYARVRYLRGEVTRCRFVPEVDIVSQMRVIKSAPEIEAIRGSAALNSAAFADVVDRSRPDWTEARLAAEIEFRMRRLGAEGAAFPTIVASGSHGALPHAEPRPKTVERGSLTIVDHGAILSGYCSDMTRMVAWGEPGATQVALFGAVLEAQAAAIDAIRPDVECRTVHSRARRVLSKVRIAGVRLDKAFVHSTGHGLGLEIHEPPHIGPRRRQRLQPGMVITVEPGAYLEGVGGARVEDVVAVTDRGCEVLTMTPRELRVVAA